MWWFEVVLADSLLRLVSTHRRSYAMNKGPLIYYTCIKAFSGNVEHRKARVIHEAVWCRLNAGSCCLMRRLLAH